MVVKVYNLHVNKYTASIRYQTNSNLINQDDNGGDNCPHNSNWFIGLFEITEN